MPLATTQNLYTLIKKSIQPVLNATGSLTSRYVSIASFTAFNNFITLLSFSKYFLYFIQPTLFHHFVCNVKEAYIKIKNST